MKRYLLIIPVFLLGLSFFMGQKSSEYPVKNNNEPMGFKIFDPHEPGINSPARGFENYVHPNTETRVVPTNIGTFLVSPNVRPLPRTNSYQSEVDIKTHPTNPNIMFGSSNSFNNTGTLFISEGVYVTTNGGTTWFGSDTCTGLPLNNHGGDPGIAIDKDGKFIMTHLGFVDDGMWGNSSSNNGLTWTSNATIQNASVDKNMAATDDNPSSPYYGRTYCVWTQWGGSYPGMVSYTTDGGVTWSAPIQFHTPAPSYIVRGADVRTAPNGDVYVIWANGGTGNGVEDFCGFSKSTNGGVTWTHNNNIFDMNGLLTFTGFPPYNIRMNSFPRIDVDKSGGPRHGWIYICASQKNLAPAGSDADIVVWRSSNGGTTWMPGVRVNQDPINNGKLQFYNAVEVDANGGVNVVYYSNANTANDSAEVIIARSVDGGNSWTEIVASDHRFKPKTIGTPGIASGYAGDYIGITSGAGKLWPIWMDDITGIYQAWTAGITIANYPLNTFNLQSPSAGTVVTSLPGSSTPVTFNWDTSATGASYKWIFGTSLPTRQITMQTGSNSLTMTLGQLDGILAGLGVAPGGQLVGSWDAWAFRPNPPANDSLKASNGPRTVTLRRGQPALSAFNLLNPPTNTTIVTSGFNSGNININWTRSGAGTTYKWKFGSPSLLSTTRFNIPSNGSGFDSVLTIQNSALDAMLGTIGLNPGDSLVGQWAVYAYSGADSLKSTQTFNLTLRRQAKGDVLVAYDSSDANCRISRDSVTSNLNSLGVTYDLYNRGTQAGTSSISFRGYKKVIILGEGTSSFSTVVKDSIKAYLNSGGTTVPTKSKLIIFSEDVGYNYGRSASSYFDADFVNNYLGFDYMADAPGGSSGAQGFRGDQINNGMFDSTAGPWPDVFKRRTGVGTHVLYRFRRHLNNPDSANSVGTYTTKWNVAVMGVDVESLRPAVGGPTGSAIRRFVKGALDYVDQIGVGVEDENIIPTVYELAQNYPNPFNPSTKINFALPKQGIVSLKVYDITGKEIAKLINEVKSAGYHTVEFNGSSLASGVYFYRIEAGDFVQTRKMLLVK